MKDAPGTGLARAASLLPAGLQRVGILARAPALILELGGDPTRALQRAGLGRDALSDPDAVIGYREGGRFLEACAAETGNTAFGLLLGRKASVADLGLIGRLMQQAPTLGEALSDLTIHQVRNTSRAVVYLTKSDADAYVGYSIYEPDMPGGLHVHLVAIAIGCRLVAELADIAPGSVHLPFAPPDAEFDRTLRRGFAAPVEFDAPFSAFSIPRALLARPLAGNDPAQRQALMHQIRDVWFASQPSLAHLVMRLAASGATWGHAALDDVAARLGLHARTLERRLREDGVGFTEIRDLARFEASRQLLLGTRMSIGQIAATLGYADASGFTHAFRRWSGTSPAAWRLAAEQGGIARFETASSGMRPAQA